MNRPSPFPQRPFLLGRFGPMLAIVGLFLSTLSGLYGNEVVSSPVLADHAVSEKEYTFYMLQLRTEVASRFMREHGIGQSEGFWKTSVGGRSPEDLLREMTLRAIARDRALLQLAVENGLLEKVPLYPDLVSMFHAENQRRQSMHERGEVFYGPVRYRQDVWFKVWFEQMARALQKQIRDSLPRENDRSSREATAKETLEGLLATRVEGLLHGLSEENLSTKTE